MTLRKLALALIAAAATAFGTPAFAATLTYQGVTFETLAVDSDTLTLNISIATVPTGDWAGIGFLKAFEIKNIGEVTGASLTGWDPNVINGLAGNALGCAPPGGTPGACFSIASAVQIDNLHPLSFTIDFQGTNLNFDAPHLKVQFLTSADDTSKTGDLLSQTLIPEPEIYAMMAIGLGVLGWGVRRKKLKEAATS